ncbi:gag-polypeptide of LTR copia-type domain-containing protein [Phthorimaea operculella]|nr:gag-polypeptide of LTR copia-type domain-containing protein [Phthorimaea operculella]
MQSTPSITKLCGQSNYASWSFAMEMFLIDNDLWDCVLAEEGYDLEDAATKKRDAKARSKICLMISENIFPLVSSAKTAKETWDALKKAYADSGLLRRLTLLRKLFGLKLEGCNSIENYVTEVQSTNQALQAIKSGLDDEFLAVVMLAGLTEDFNPLVMALEHSAKKLTTELVISALYKEGQRTRTGNVTGDSVLAAASRSSSSGGGGGKNKLICRFCNKAGHMKWQCKLLKKQQLTKKDSGASDSRNRNANARSDTGNIATTSFSLLSNVCNKDNWVVDSGASSHMTASGDQLVDVKEEHTTITTANNHKVDSDRRGTVKLLEHDVQLEEVLHVPDLLTNLLSVGKACDKGCCAVFDDKCCRIVLKQNVIVKGKPILSATRKDGLYLVESGSKALAIPDRVTALLLFKYPASREYRLNNVKQHVMNLMLDKRTAVWREILLIPLQFQMMKLKYQNQWKIFRFLQKQDAILREIDDLV